jgi:hypothetical protein
MSRAVRNGEPFALSEHLPILLRGLPLGYPPGYQTTLSMHATAAQAYAWGLISGLASTGRLWIEKAGEPATKDQP